MSDRTSHPRRATGTDDRDLRQLFETARRADASRIPAFDRLAQTSPSRRRRPLTPLRLAAAGALTAALGLVLWTWPSPPPAPVQIATVRIDWLGPTDFLLDIDGELLSTLPAVGLPPSLVGADPDNLTSAPPPSDAK